MSVVDPVRSPAAVLAMLTTREQEVAVRIAEAKPLKVISRELGISWHTVGNYCTRIYARLGIQRSAQLVALLRPTSGLTAAMPAPIDPSKRLISIIVLQRWKRYAEYAEQAKAQGSANLALEIDTLLGEA